MSAVGSHLGVTPPLSLDTSSPSDLENTDALMETLRKFNVFEPEEEAKKRYAKCASLSIDLDFLARLCSQDLT